jgi:TRAP-type uncharacterized transport system substrate-binding protein
MQRRFNRAAIVLLVTLAVGVSIVLVYTSYPWLFSARYTIRIATGPVTAFGDKFAAEFRREMAVEYPRVRVTLVHAADLDASADALKSGRVDAAFVRSDNPMVAEGRTLVVMRKIAAVTILGPGSETESWSDLKGEKIGVLSETGKIDPLQKIVLDFYGVKEAEIRLVAPKQAGAEIARGHVAALLAVGPAGPGVIADAARAVRLATRKPAKLLDFDEAEAIAARYPAYEKLDIAQGTFAGSPAVPAEDATGLAATVRLVSKPSLSNYAAGELTRIILATKARLAASTPGVGQIEAPDTDHPLFPIHPGTAAYLGGEKPDLLDDSLTYLYLGSMLLGGFGSLGAWLAAFWSRRLQRDINTRVAVLPSYLGAIRGASAEDLDSIEAELDQLSEWLVEHYVNEKIPMERYSAIEAKLAEIRVIMGRRRAMAGKDQNGRPLGEAA